MAIGDSYAVYMGTATTNRQPSSGVFEEISSLVKFATSDNLVMYDGTTALVLMDTGMLTSESTDQTGSPPSGVNYYNTAIKIGNAVYIQKTGSTDEHAISGVQVDA